MIISKMFMIYLYVIIYFYLFPTVWSQNGNSTITDCSSYTSCSSCVSTTSEDCIWCTDNSECLLGSTSDEHCSSTGITGSCGESYYTIIFVCVIGSLTCICCGACYYRKYHSYTDESLLSPLVSPADRGLLFRNSLLSKGEYEWMCVICGFDNHPRHKQCSMCGTSHEFSLNYKIEKNEKRKLKKQLLRNEKLRNKPKHPVPLPEDLRISSYFSNLSNNSNKNIASMNSSEEKSNVEVVTSEENEEADSTSINTAINAAINITPIKSNNFQLFNRGSSLTSDKRREAMNYRRLNQLTLRQKSARRRKIWQRVYNKETNEFNWIRVPISDVMINNTPFGYTPGNSMVGSTKSSIDGSQNNNVDANQILLAAAASGSAPNDSSISIIPGLSNQLYNSTMTSSYRSTKSTDSFGDNAAYSISPGYTSRLDRDGNLNWEKIDQPSTKTYQRNKQLVLPTTVKDTKTNINDSLFSNTLSPLRNTTGAGSSFFVNTYSNSSTRSSGGISISNPIVNHHVRIDINETNDSFQYDLETIASLTFKEKQLWFLDRMGEIQIPWTEGCMRLEIRRQELLKDSVATFGNAKAVDLHKWMRVQFADEPGIDAGGLEREWIELVTKELLLPQTGLFISIGNESLTSNYHINPLACLILPNTYLISYKFAGRLIGKALMESQPVSLNLSLPIRKQLLSMPITFSDLEFVDSELFRNLQWLLNYENVDELDIYFTITYTDAYYKDKSLTYELINNGKNILVTNENKKDYLDLILRHRLYDSIKSSLEAFMKGFYEIIPYNLISVFDYQELEILMCGLIEIDVSDWMSHTEYLGEYNRLGGKHKVIKWFWKTVENMTREERIRLLQFATGCARLPIQGFKALQSNDGNYRKFNIQSISKKDSLYPRSHTCFNKIDLPLYDTEAELEAYLSVVVNMEITGFSME